MLESIVVVLFVLWLLGLGTSYTMGGLIHGLLMIAATFVYPGFHNARASHPPRHPA